MGEMKCPTYFCRFKESKWVPTKAFERFGGDVKCVHCAPLGKTKNMRSSMSILGFQTFNPRVATGFNPSRADKYPVPSPKSSPDIRIKVTSPRKRRLAVLERKAI